MPDTRIRRDNIADVLRKKFAFSRCHLPWDIVYGIRSWCRMKIGLWNVDHPETGSGRAGEEKRFDEVVRYLGRCDCDLLITTEGNAAIGIPGYLSEFSDLSPFRSTRRFYGAPNLKVPLRNWSKMNESSSGGHTTTHKNPKEAKTTRRDQITSEAWVKAH